MVYYEEDDHLGASDVSRLLYKSSRLNDNKIISRQDMADSFGEYAYDSGLITQVYDDRPMVFGTNHLEQTYNKYPTLLDLSKGRLCVTAARYPAGNGPSPYTYTSPDPASPDALYESIVKVDIKLEIMVDLGFGEDIKGRSWTGGTPITDSDFSGRFMEFIPNWEDYPTGQPVPALWGFAGVGMDDIRLNTDLSFRMDRFKIDMQNVRYQEVYSMPPKLRPNPEEGPFSTADFPPVYVQYDYPFLADIFNFYYTLDGTDPDESSTPFSYPGEINIDTDTDNPDTHMKVIAVEEGKEPSKIVDVWYVFEKAGGSALEVTISNNPELDETGVFIGLFLDESLNLDQELAPVYSEFGTISGGGATCTFANVDGGTYYLAVIADVDNNKKVSTGDYLYPDQDPGRSSTDMFVSLSSSEVVLPRGTPFYIDTADWFIVP